MFFTVLKQKSSTICRLLYISILFIALPLSAQQQVFWVNTIGNDTTDGSQITPFATISHALSVIQDLDTIRIEPGIYYEQLNITGLTGVNDFVMQGASLSDTIAIISPFPGPVISINMPFTTQTQFLNLFISHLNPDTMGVGIEIFNASPTIENCTITRNRSVSQGGGIRVFDSGATESPLIRNCHIADNEAPGGAGIYAQNSAMTVEYSRIEFNRSLTGNGGGMFFLDCDDLNIQYNQIHANQGGNGAGIYLDVSGVSDTLIQSNSIMNNLIYRNDALYAGAGMYVYGNSVNNTIFNNTFGENFAQGNGGGLFVEFADNIILNNNIFVNNNSQQNGGGICLMNMTGISIDLWSNHISGNIAAIDGGGLYLSDCDNLTVGGAVSLQNNFYHNRASGVQNAISSATTIASLNLTNNYWGFPEISAVQLQINIPGSNLSGLAFESQPYNLSIPLIGGQTLYYFGDGFIEFRPEAMMVTGSDYLDISTTIDTMLSPTSGLNFLGKRYAINFTGINTNLPTDLFLYFDQSELDNVGNPPRQELQVAFFDGELFDWFTQPSFVDETRQLVMANFSMFPHSEFSIAFNAMESDSLLEVYPEPNRTDIAEDATVEIFFKRPVDESTLAPQSVIITGQYSGVHEFYQQYDPEELHLRVNPHSPFIPGEEVIVTLSPSILDDTSMPFSEGFTWKFHIGAFLGNTEFVPGTVSDMRFDPVKYQLADVTGDQFPDLVELSFTHLTLFANDHSGNFYAYDSLALGTQYRLMGVDDLDKDNQPEIVIVNEMDITIYEYVYSNNKFSPMHTETLNLDGTVVDMTLADFNNDGLVDICLLIDYGSFYETSVYFSDMSAGFFLNSPLNNVLAGFPTKLIQADVNNDGFIDIVANSGTSENDLTLLINQIGVSFNRVISTAMDVQYPSGFAAANVWRGVPYDMQREIIVSGERVATYEPTVSLISAQPDGNLTTLHNETLPSLIMSMMTIDITSDGFMDVVVCNAEGDIQILQQDANRFIHLPLLAEDLMTNQLLAADLDLDGDIDLLSFEQSASIARWQLLVNNTRNNRSFYVDSRSNGGNGDFDNPFQNIYEALIRTIDADSIIVFGGSYNDCLYIDKNLVLNSVGYEQVIMQPFVKFSFDSAIITIENVSRVEIDNFHIMQDSLVEGELPPDNIIGIRGINADSLILRNISVWGPAVGLEVDNVNLDLSRIYIERCGVGIKAQNSNLDMTHVALERNHIAGMKISTSDMVLDEGNFANNGHGPIDYEGGIIVENNSTIQMRFFEISNNGVANIILRNSSGDFQYGGIFDAFVHTASDPGAGFYAQNATSLNIYNTVIAGNNKYGVYTQNSNADIQNNIIGKNDSLSATANGGGIRVEGGNARIVNNVLGMNNFGVFAEAASVEVNYNDFIDNTSDFNSDIAGVGNLNEDPLFVSDYFVFGGRYMSSDSGFDPFQFKLAPGSPLIDRGDPTLFNNDNSRSDIGMFGAMDSSLALNIRPEPIISVADSSISMSWSALDAGMDSLFRATVIFRSTQAAFVPDSSQLIALLFENVNEYIDRNLEFGQSYYYKLAFVDIHGGVAGYSIEVSGRLDFHDFYFGRNQEFVQLGQGDSMQKTVRVYNSGTLPLQVQVQDGVNLPTWLTVSPPSVNIAATDSAEFTLNFSAVGMPRDTLLQHTVIFDSPDYVTLVDSINVRMLVSYRDLFAPQTMMIGTYPDTIRQSILRFSFLGDDQSQSAIGTPSELLRYQYSLHRVLLTDTTQVFIAITNQTMLTFNPIHDGRYVFRVAALDTSNRGGLNSNSEVWQVVVVHAGPTPSPANVWQMITPSRRLDQFSNFLGNDAVLSIKSWKNEEYLDVTPENIKYGRGYWVITNRNRVYNWDNMDFLQQDTLVAVALAPGWSQIGNPWAWNINLDSCQIVSNDDRILTYEAALEEGLILSELYYNEVVPIRRYVRVLDKKLMPKYGYWIYANQPVRIHYDSRPEAPVENVDISPTESVTKTAHSSDVLINLKAQSGKFADSENFFGVCDNLNNYIRLYQPALEPPVMTDYLYLYNVENNRRWSGFFKENQSDTEEWDIRLERGKVDHETTLRWEWLETSNDMHLYLYHLETGQWFNMNDQAAYSFENKRKINHFKLYASEDDNFEPDVLPVEFTLSQNYPNPFNLQTTIELAVPFFANNRQADLIVYDILGRQVKKLHSGPISSGYIKMNWDGKNDAGVILASGLYILHLSTEGFRAAKKMILIK